MNSRTIRVSGDSEVVNRLTAGGILVIFGITVSFVVLLPRFIINRDDMSVEYRCLRSLALVLEQYWLNEYTKDPEFTPLADPDTSLEIIDKWINSAEGMHQATVNRDVKQQVLSHFRAFSFRMPAYSADRSSDRYCFAGIGTNRGEVYLITEGFRPTLIHLTADDAATAELVKLSRSEIESRYANVSSNKGH